MSSSTSNSAQASQAADNDGTHDNPFGLSKFMSNNGLELYGAIVMNTPVNDDPVTHVKNIRALKLRDDDVFVLAYPKCGTNWTWEVTQMLVNQRTKFETRSKAHVMLEFCDLSVVDDEPSPRILNSHNWMVHLPQELITKRTKIVHIVRNPKDTLVSLYYHARQMPGNTFTFDSLFDAYLAKTAMAFTNQFDFLRQMSEFEKQHPSHPVKLIYYEEMKKDPVRVTKELAKFLQVPATDEFCEDVAEACSFDKMKRMDETRDHPEIIKVHLSGPQKLQVYRKGTIGDWKNHFTVAQNEIFDDFIAKESKGLDYKFIYE